ncbi:uncharacterized protein NPIL_589261 [Nephila pilipes]|uniref:Uncharacterized protein n=1 Tax=Nephila pilipes TaxID=299642 RepID=A0A8X6PDZ7_NEPPI|nr:uncharacterized protein NPIL_589261 [Nephila pilipes]
MNNSIENNSMQFYEDNIKGQDSVQDTLEVSCSGKQIMQKAAMVIRKWITNESDLMDRWKQEGFGTQQEHNSISLGSNSAKALGKACNTEEYLITEILTLLEFLSSKKNTKRFLLQASRGKIFDPLGVLIPFTICVKYLFQEKGLGKFLGMKICHLKFKKDGCDGAQNFHDFQI